MQTVKSRFRLENSMSFVIYFIIGLLVLFEHPSITVYLILAQLIRILLWPLSNSLLAVGGISFIYLFALPSLALNHFGMIDTGPYVAMYIIFIDTMRFCSLLLDRVNFPALKSMQSQKGYDWIVMIALIALACILPSILPEGDFRMIIGFMFPFGGALIFLEKTLMLGMTRLLAILTLLFFIAMIGVFISLYWSGYGRLVVGTYAVIPMVLVMSKLDIGLRLWQATLGAPVALALAAQSRYGFIEIEKVFIGSAGHHLIITEELDWRSLNVTPDWSEFWAQFSLMFLNWFPRSLWELKPLGVGLTAVDDWYGRAGFPDSFTISMGMFGETFYTLGEYAIIGNIIIVVALLLTRKVIGSLSRGFTAPIICFDISLLSYIWGGAATFGSRAWFLIFPVLIIGFFVGRFRSHGRDRSPVSLLQNVNEVSMS